MSSEFIQSVLEGKRKHAGKLVNAVIPEDWPVDDAAREGLKIHLEHLRKDPSEVEWRVHLIVNREKHKVIGSVSFTGPPNSNGTVELGWGEGGNPTLSRPWGCD